MLEAGERRRLRADRIDLTRRASRRRIARAARRSRATSGSTTRQPHFVGVPPGGYKQSGIGREESIEELYAFSQTKNINITLLTMDLGLAGKRVLVTGGTGGIGRAIVHAFRRAKARTSR